jgi:Lipopolysaccharide-assembly
MSLWFRTQILIFLGVSLGCGYSLSHRLKKEFDQPKGIFVPIFSNDTEELGAEFVFTNALLKELKLHQSVKVVNHREESPFELKGNVENISYQPTALYAPAVGVNKLQPYATIPDQINLVVTVKLTLQERGSKTPLWTQTVRGSRMVSAYLGRTGDKEAASGFGLYTQSLIEAKYQEVAKDLMRDAYDSMLENM